MTIRILLCALAVLLSASCGKPTPGTSDDTGSGEQTDSGDTSVVVNNTVSGGDGGSDACGDIAVRFTDAVRAIPRDCIIDADCKLLPRAQSCDCDLAVTASSDTAAYDAVRAEADAAQCANPFGCATGQCPYRRLSSGGEIYPHCNAEGQCETLQIMGCDEYATKAQGGIVSPGSCETDADCGLRNDLNPCDCNEAVTKSFPFLSTQAIYELIAINDERCGSTCTACDLPAGVVCATDSEGLKYCATN